MIGITVAIVGGGAAGIIGARRCLLEGLQPTVFEATSSVGGHWSRAEDAPTAVYDSLKSNIPFYEMAVSDVLPLRDGPNMENGPNASLYSNPKELGEYLDHIIASTAGLEECFRVNTRVVAVRRVEEGYTVTSERKGIVTTEEYDRVIIATGRTRLPNIPEVTGIEHFRGDIMHSTEYRRPQQFEGKAVLVVGGNLSGPEIAGDLGDTPVGHGASSVTFLTRKMKHYVGKQRNNASFTSVIFSNIASAQLRSGARTQLEMLGAWRKELEEKFNTNEEYNMPTAGPDVLSFIASQCFLDAAKSGHKLSFRIGTIDCITEDGMVRFDDGEEQHYDAIVFATGYKIDVEALDGEVDVRVAEKCLKGVPELDLYLHTWHPDLPGCGFLGQLYIFGSAFLFFDLQSRWIARSFATGGPTQSEVEEGVATRRKLRAQAGYIAVEFCTPVLHQWAARAGCAVDYSAYPELASALLAGPFVPMQFALCGRGAVDNPVTAYRAAVRKAGADIDTIRVTPQQLEQLQQCVGAFVRNGGMPAGFDEAVEQVGRKMGGFQGRKGRRK